MNGESFGKLLPPRPQSEHRRRTAGHETAHLVTAHLLAHNVEAVDIAPGIVERHLGTAGFMEHRRGGADPFSDVVVAVAGLVFDTMNGGSIDYDRAFDAAGDDRRNAAKAAEYLEPCNPDGLLVRAQAIARQLLERHWTAVERIADQLLVVGRMEGAYLTSSIEAALSGEDVVEWVLRRRAAVDAGAPDPARRRWHGVARDETREIYETTWQAAQERSLAEMLRRRAEIEAGGR